MSTSSVTVLSGTGWCKQAGRQEGRLKLKDLCEADVLCSSGSFEPANKTETVTMLH